MNSLLPDVFARGFCVAKSIPAHKRELGFCAVDTVITDPNTGVGKGSLCIVKVLRRENRKLFLEFHPQITGKEVFPIHQILETKGTFVLSRGTNVHPEWTIDREELDKVIRVISCHWPTEELHAGMFGGVF